MGKRSEFKRIEKDFYETPKEAIPSLSAHLEPHFKYVEPCAGAGKLIGLLESINGKCVMACDLQPQNDDIIQADFMDDVEIPEEADYIITNPPWTRSILHPFLEKYMRIRPTWILLDADWSQTKQSSELMKYCVKTVAVGRLKWIPDSPHTGKDNCMWYLFDKYEVSFTQFYGR